MYYGLQGSIIAVAGKRDELLAILERAAAAMEANPDCHLYVVSRVLDDANAVWVSEVWTNKEAHDKSLEPEETQEMIMQARPLIASFGERFELETVGGKGLENLAA
jgi:quinol monooxygenase YgiN